MEEETRADLLRIYYRPTDRCLAGFFEQAGAPVFDQRILKMMTVQRSPL